MRFVKLATIVFQHANYKCILLIKLQTKLKFNLIFLFIYFILGLFEGDILGIDPTVSDRNLMTNKTRLWPDGKVYYTIAPELGCLSCETSVLEPLPLFYISFSLKCFSSVGMVGGQQVLSLASGCWFHGTVLHELGHALGLYHEHNRSDRDKYLKIHLENVRESILSKYINAVLCNKKLGSPNSSPHKQTMMVHFNLKRLTIGCAFEVRRPSKPNFLVTPFDYESVMIYGPASFTKNGLTTMEVLEKGVTINSPFDKKALSKYDLIDLSILYSCLGHTYPTELPPLEIFCDFEHGPCRFKSLDAAKFVLVYQRDGNEYRLFDPDYMPYHGTGPACMSFKYKIDGSLDDRSSFVAYDKNYYMEETALGPGSTDGWKTMKSENQL
ncbi:Astacin-like metalloprotease toxin 1 [Nymphon striatum]|nr:Astacin-like metalloprotease toxin 1 [Nymphon striatum]